MNAFPRGFVAVLAISLIAISAHPDDAAAYANACQNSVTPNSRQISVTMTATASGPVAPGGTITLSSIQQTATIPGEIFVAGYNLGLLTEGANNIPANVFTDIEGTNTTEGVQTTSIEAVLIATTIDDPDNAPGSGDETATDGQFTANYDDQTWTAGAGPGTVAFRQDTQYPIVPSPAGSEQGALIVRALVGGFLQVRFACSPGTVTPPDPGTVTPIDPAETFASADIVVSTPTATDEPTPTDTTAPTPSDAETPTPTVTETPSETETPTPTATETETPVPTETETPVPTETETPVATDTATPTPTPTATPTPSVTATPTSTVVPTPEPLNHFLCYETHQAPVNRVGVKLEDQFDPPGQPSTVKVQKAKRLCAPADKESEDPTAPDDVAHLTAYTIKQTSPKFERRGPIPVAPDNPILFPMTVTLTRPSRLLVPAAKALGTTPPAALAAPIDHYKCYRVKGARTRLAGVSVETQFGPVTVDIKKPIELCTPVDKNGEGIVDDLHHLLCYQVRAAAQAPLTVSTNNQFEDKTLDVFGIRELCVPAFKFPGFCSDGELNAPGEQCDGADDSACPGDCQPDCKCPPPTCGDGVVNLPGEICDGNDGPCPGNCNVGCTCDPFCGDDSVNDQGEQCDGVDDSNCDGLCDDQSCLCPPPLCNNGVKELGEQCDTTPVGCFPPFETCTASCNCCAPPQCQPFVSCGLLPNACGAPINCGQQCLPGNACVGNTCQPVCAEEGEPCTFSAVPLDCCPGLSCCPDTARGTFGPTCCELD